MCATREHGRTSMLPPHCHTCGAARGGRGVPAGQRARPPPPGGAAFPLGITRQAPLPPGALPPTVRRRLGHLRARAQAGGRGAPELAVWPTGCWGLGHVPFLPPSAPGEAWASPGLPPGVTDAWLGAGWGWLWGWETHMFAGSLGAPARGTQVSTLGAQGGLGRPLLEFEAGQPLTCPRRPASQGLPCWGPRCWPAPTSSPRLHLHLHHPLSSRALLSPGARPPVHSEEGPALLFLAGAAAARMLPAPPPSKHLNQPFLALHGSGVHA